MKAKNFKSFSNLLSNKYNKKFHGLMNFNEALKTIKESNIIKITVEGGCVVSVDNLPKNCKYQIIDKDNN